VNSFVWPFQANPTQHDWQIWKEGIQQIWYDNRQSSKLGQWYEDANSNWFFSPSEQCLFQKIDNSWLKYSRPSRITRQQYFIIIGTSAPTSPLHCAYVSKFKEYWVCHGFHTIPFQRPAPPKSLKHYIDALPIEVSWSMRNFISTDDGKILAQALSNGTAIAVCDGSYKQGKGASAWVMEGDSSKGRIKGFNWVSGSTVNQSSYRSELAGLLGIVTFTIELCKYHSIKEASITIACDNISALLNSLDQDSYTSILDPDHDLITAIQKLLQTPGITWLYRHVRGHQDDKKAINELDHWEKLNIEMDALAKHTLAQTPNCLSQIAQGEPWSIWINQTKIIKDIATNIYDHIHGKEALNYWL
jgi:hypothetical protein